MTTATGLMDQHRLAYLPDVALPEEAGVAPGELAPGRQPGLAVELARVAKRFGEREVLKALDLEIPPGQFVAIVGRSGGGKSTLLRLLAGLDTPSSGSVLLGIIIYALLGRLADVLTRRLEQRCLAWHPAYQAAAAEVTP